MSNKSKKAKSQPHPAARAHLTATAAPLPVNEPTADQRARLEKGDVQVEALSAELGPAVVEAPPEPPGPTLEACLRRVETLLKDARTVFERAKLREAAVKTEEERLGGEKRAQEEALKQSRRAAEAQLEARKQEQEASELELLRRVEACEQRERTVDRRESELDAREVVLVERSAALTERELNAEQGFRAEKLRILATVEKEAARLRDERDGLAQEIAAKQAASEKAARAAADERAAAWAQDDARRSQAAAEARRALDAELARTRESEQAKLRSELQDRRARADVELQKYQDARRVNLDAEAAALDARARTLAEKERQSKNAERDLQAEQELFADDRAALTKKVERLVGERTESLRHEAASLARQLVDARAQRDAYATELDARRELDRRFGSKAPEQILADLIEHERERDLLTQQLRERPDARAGERLVALERERSSWLEEQAVLRGDLAKAMGELATRRLAAIELESLRKEKEALQVHKQLLDCALAELNTRVKELTRQEEHRNPMTALTSLDHDEALQNEKRTTSPLRQATPTLREFADDLRHRIATGVEGRTLYYAERDIRAFLGGLAMTRLMLLQGISGTGKTSLPLAFAKAVDGGCEVIEVQAGWRDRQDLVGYYNAFHRHYYATNFLQALYRAGTPAYRDRLFLMVLDEINLSRPEQFFADFLSALEQPQESRRLTLVSDPVADAPRLLLDGRHLPIPPNVWFIGTANHDETTAEFADKTYDRAHVMEMPRNTGAARFEIQSRGTRTAISYKALTEVFEAARTDQAVAVERARTWLQSAPFAGTIEQRFRIGWGNRLEQQLAAYLPVVVAAGGTIGEAIDHLLVTKVLRKLKDRHDVRVDALEQLQEQLVTDWRKLDATRPERCLDLLGKEIAAKKVESNE
ncbi:hypothetical protein OV090_12520 [Nannocystis sp. RBIL2]|uniref:hypothetical protein n=1 Tax=Nannocystis sp. RBIL2 TaxID=2996788 RepID=UPI0022708A89|nr:hypothetical protein [Nannocystis sp. RBIL2]MCY1065596.1 hypothetical protein [Nannocystis sp. RBIL2]